MTFSGLLMLVLVALVAYVLCLGWKKHLWGIPLDVGAGGRPVFLSRRAAPGWEPSWESP